MSISISKTIFATLLFVTAGAAHAATVNNRVFISNGGAGTSGCGTAPSVVDTKINGSLSVNVNDGALGCTMTADGYAGGGAVGVRGTLNFTPGSTTGGLIRSTVNSTMSDIFITPLFDVTDPAEIAKYGYRIPVTLNAAIEGVLTAAAETISGFGTSGQARLFATATLSGSGGTVSAGSNENATAGSVGLSGPDAGSSVFADNLSVTLLQDWRGPISVIFNMTADAGIANNGGGFATATYDSFNSLSFSKTGPAFTLPDGFTVNAPELGIFDNRWIDPRAPVGPTPVPLPASLPLLLLGCLAFGAIGRTRRRSIG